MALDQQLRAGEPVPIARSVGRWRLAVQRLRRDPAGLVALVALLILATVATGAPWIVSGSIGNEQAAELLAAAPLSLGLAVAPVLLALVVGGVIGIAAGARDNAFAAVVIRVTSAARMLPLVLLLAALVTSLRPGPASLVTLMAIGFVPQFVSVAGSATAALRASDFHAVGLATGATARSLLRHHVVRHLLPPLLVAALRLLAVAMVMTAGLALLGLAPQPPAVTWGGQLLNLRLAVPFDWLHCVVPAALIAAVVIAVTVLAERLRIALDLPPA
jgi:peptide/nickel transport system permease protein